MHWIGWRGVVGVREAERLAAPAIPWFVRGRPEKPWREWLSPRFEYCHAGGHSHLPTVAAHTDVPRKILRGLNGNPNEAERAFLRSTSQPE
jgi:hypothetical protein